LDLQAQQGLMDTYRAPWRTRGAAAWFVSLLLFAFYISLYFAGELNLTFLDDLASKIGLRNRWFIYGLTYSVWMVGGAIRYLRQHGNSRYHQVRIAVNVAIQVVLGFAIPFVMEPEFYFSYFWPLSYDKLFPHSLSGLPVYLAAYTALGSLVAAPLLAVFFGKRWYCSWVCGCGALANTFGDPWRHLTSKSTASWRFEKISIHTTMFFCFAMTAIVALYQLNIGHGTPFDDVYHYTKESYKFIVGAVLSGVIGTAVYPLLGPRIWCRNFCPMAALLGASQKLGRFRIRVKPDMCISCGNCSAYCEMGIDVRSYAQSNQSFTRSACVGCGMCAHVCPRGVLRLENDWPLSEDKGLQGLQTVDY